MNAEPKLPLKVPRAIPLDTTREAYEVQMGIVRQMSPERRLDAIYQLCDFVRCTMASGVRTRHPGYSPEEVRLGTIRLCLGEQLFRQAYPGIDIRP